MSDSKLPDRIAAWLLAHPRAVGAMLVLAVVASLATIPLLKIETGWDSFYDPHTPQKKILDEVKAHFVNDELLYVGYESKDPFSAEALRAVRTLGIVLEGLTAPGDDGKPVNL